MMDSGASSHFTPYKEDYTSYKTHTGVEIVLGDTSIQKSAGIGSVTIKTDRGYNLVLSNVLHVPQTRSRILSTSRLAEKDALVLFDKASFTIRHKGNTIAEGYQAGHLYWLKVQPVLNLHLPQSVADAKASIDIWHLRFAHLARDALSRDALQDAVTGMHISSYEFKDELCHGCQTGKSHRLPFPPSHKRATKPLEVIHSDLVGPLQSLSIQGNQYFATFLDDFSKAVVVIYMKTKDQFTQAFKYYKAWAEKQLDTPILCLHSDRGGEYINKNLGQFLKEEGIEHKVTMPYSPQQNGRAERFNRTIMEKGTSMLHHAGLSLGFWETAVATAVHIYNRTPTRSNQWRAPLQLWDGTKPDVSYFRVYGCKAYYHVPEHNRRKLDPKAREAVFVGYETLSKGYTLWDRRSRTFISSRDVTFDEASFPSRSDVGTQTPLHSISPPSIPTGGTIAVYPVDVHPRVPSQPLPAVATTAPQAPQMSTQGLPTQAPGASAPASTQPRTPQRPTNTQTSDSTLFQTPPTHPSTSSNPPARPEPRPTRTRRIPRNVNSIPPPVFDPIPRNTNRDVAMELPPMPELRRGTRDRRPNRRYLQTEDDELEEVSVHDVRFGFMQLLHAAEVPSRDPFTFKEAMESPDAEDWQQACQYELDALAKLKVWTLVDRPINRKAVKNRWVFKKKANGTFRARLVAKGFTQLEGVDFDETFSPVARFESLRLLLALATLEDWEIHQMDVKSAFLHGELEEEIYMEQPVGFITAGQEDKVCLLQKALYGLKQASRAWNLQFHGVLTELGFTRTYSDAGVYVYHHREGGDSLFVILYVDDITILGSSLHKINDLKKSLSSRYEMTDLGEIQSYLGVNITRDRANRTMMINQTDYICGVVERFGMTDANPVYTPLPAGVEAHLVKFEDQASTSEIKKYQQLIGSLLYAQIGSRPDISFAVARLSQFASNPSPQHLRLAKYVLSYLNTTKDLQLRYAGGTSGDGLVGYADSSWGDQEDKHSTSGYVFLLANAPISWCMRKQKTVAQSTTEAEYMSICDASNQAQWYRTFLKELGYEVTSPISLHCDNKGAVDLALNPVTGRRSKHISIKYHAIREYVETGVVNLVRTPTGEMLADGLTKSLARAPFDQMISDFGFAK
jgi:transposase InsO family protein